MQGFRSYYKNMILTFHCILLIQSPGLCQYLETETVSSGCGHGAADICSLFYFCLRYYIVFFPKLFLSLKKERKTADINAVWKFVFMVSVVNNSVLESCSCFMSLDPQTIAFVIGVMLTYGCLVFICYSHLNSS